jgi:hypothetical protein
MQQTTPSAGILTLFTIVLAFFAIARSPRKINTALLIVGAMLICGLVGAGIGLARSSPEAAGALAAIAMQFGGIAASIERIRRYRKTGPTYKTKQL